MVTDIRPATRETVEEMYDRLAKFRATEPVGYDEEHDSWNIYDYPCSARALTDHASFSSEVTGLYPADPDFERFLTGDFVTLDPPRHRRYRKLVGRAFTPEAVQRLRPKVAAMTGTLLDAVAGRERFDLIDAVFRPLPMMVIADLLGVPAGDRDLFRGWADFLLGMDGEDTRPDRNLLDTILPTLRDIEAYVLDHVRARRADPRDDLISVLAARDLDGERLEDHEIVGVVALLLLAGYITSTVLLSNLVLCLDEHPSAAAELRADRGLLPSAVEETLRYLTPNPRSPRITLRSVEIGGRVVPADKAVSVWVGSANRDETHFPGPDVFDLHRSPNQHLAFGHGIHFCLGAPLARIEAAVASAVLLDRCAELAICRDEPLPYYDPYGMVGPIRLPVEAVWS